MMVDILDVGLVFMKVMLGFIVVLCGWLIAVAIWRLTAKKRSALMDDDLWIIVTIGLLGLLIFAWHNSNLYIWGSLDKVCHSDCCGYAESEIAVENTKPLITCTYLDDTEEYDYSVSFADTDGENITFRVVVNNARGSASLLCLESRLLLDVVPANS